MIFKLMHRFFLLEFVITYKQHIYYETRIMQKKLSLESRCQNNRGHALSSNVGLRKTLKVVSGAAKRSISLF